MRSQLLVHFKNLQGDLGLLGGREGQSCLTMIAASVHFGFLKQCMSVMQDRPYIL